MTTTMQPDRLSAFARELIEQPDDSSSGLWPRAAALLLRQAAETILDELWEARAQGMQKAPMRSQLVALPLVLRDGDLSGRTSYTWWVLSNACHYRYGASPLDAQELRHAADLVDELSQAVSRRIGDNQA